MIFSSIKVNEGITKYPEAIQVAIAYLKAHDFSTMELGRYPIQGDEIYAQVIEAHTAPREERRAEAHEKFIDVQFLVSGKEKIGFAVATKGYEIEEKVEERDLIFYNVPEDEGEINLTPGCYGIFFPEDIHRPAINVEEPEAIRKVVVKVSTSVL